MENNKGGDIIAHFYGRVDEIFCFSSFCSDQRSLEQGIWGKTDQHVSLQGGVPAITRTACRAHPLARGLLLKRYCWLCLRKL